MKTDGCDGEATNHSAGGYFPEGSIVSFNCVMNRQKKVPPVNGFGDRV